MRYLDSALHSALLRLLLIRLAVGEVPSEGDLCERGAVEIDRECEALGASGVRVDVLLAKDEEAAWLATHQIGWTSILIEVSSRTRPFHHHSPHSSLAAHFSSTHPLTALLSPAVVEPQDTVALQHAREMLRKMPSVVKVEAFSSADAGSCHSQSTCGVERMSAILSECSKKLDLDEHLASRWRCAGLTLNTLSACRAGEAILSIPLSQCITAADGSRVGEHIDQADTFGRLLAALLHLTELQEDERALYYLKLCPPDCFASHIACWAPEGRWTMCVE